MINFSCHLMTRTEQQWLAIAANNNKFQKGVPSMANNKPQKSNNNKPQKFKETERFSIRRAAFWFSGAAVVYFAKTWDVRGMLIFGAVFLLTLISRFLSWLEENKKKSNHRD